MTSPPLVMDSVSIGSGKSAHLMELSDQTLREAAPDIDDDGLWLVVEDEAAGTLEPLALVASLDAGRRILEMIGGSRG